MSEEEKNKIDPKTVYKIARNAKKSQEAWESFSSDENLKVNFHLRPVKDGVTIVSTLPAAPMRGIRVSIADLAKQLKAITGQKAKLLSDNYNVLEPLKKLGFKSRKEERFREEDVQAMFIQGMISKQEIYDGIEFVASELTLDGKNRLDVVGLKDNILYIFELKKKRKFDGLAQTAEYIKLVEQNKSYFLDVLSCYPNNPVTTFKSVRGVAVMRYAANATKELITKANNNNVGLWYYEKSISFPQKM